MNQGMISKLTSVLEASLSKLSRYDEGSLIGSILSFTVSLEFHFSTIVESYNESGRMSLIFFFFLLFVGTIETQKSNRNYQNEQKRTKSFKTINNIPKRAKKTETNYCKTLFNSNFSIDHKR